MRTECDEMKRKNGGGPGGTYYAKRDALVPVGYPDIPCLERNATVWTAMFNERQDADQLAGADWK